MLNRLPFPTHSQEAARRAAKGEEEKEGDEEEDDEKDELDRIEEELLALEAEREAAAAAGPPTGQDSDGDQQVASGAWGIERGDLAPAASRKRSRDTEGGAGRVMAGSEGGDIAEGAFRGR